MYARGSREGGREEGRNDKSFSFPLSIFCLSPSPLWRTLERRVGRRACTTCFSSSGTNLRDEIRQLCIAPNEIALDTNAIQRYVAISFIHTELDFFNEVEMHILLSSWFFQEMHLNPNSKLFNWGESFCLPTIQGRPWQKELLPPPRDRLPPVTSLSKLWNLQRQFVRILSPSSSSTNIV